jgi:hypothetical protein
MPRRTRCLAPPDRLDFRALCGDASARLVKISEASCRFQRGGLSHHPRLAVQEPLERAGWRLARAADRRSLGPRRSRRGSPAPQAGGQTRSSCGRMSPLRTTRPRRNYHLVTRPCVCATNRARPSSFLVARGLNRLQREEARGEGGPAGGLRGGAGRPGFRMGGGGGGVAG